MDFSLDYAMTKPDKLKGFPKIEEMLVGVQYEIKNKDYGTDFVEMYFGKEVAPDFFATWRAFLPLLQP